MLGEVSYIQILESRIALKTSVIKFFIDRAEEKMYGELEECFEKMIVYSKNEDLFFSQDVLFHKILARGSGNPIVYKILNIIFKIMEGRPKEEYQKLSSKERIEEHRKILEAIKNRDEELAKIFLERHLQRTIDDLKKL